MGGSTAATIRQPDVWVGQTGLVMAGFTAIGHGNPVAGGDGHIESGVAGGRCRRCVAVNATGNISPCIRLMRHYRIRVMPGLVMAQRAVEAAGCGALGCRSWRRMGIRAAEVALGTGGSIAYIRARVSQPVRIRAGPPVGCMRGVAAVGGGMAVDTADTYS